MTVGRVNRLKTKAYLLDLRIYGLIVLSHDQAKGDVFWRSSEEAS